MRSFKLNRNFITISLVLVIANSIVCGLLDAGLAAMIITNLILVGTIYFLTHDVH